MGAGAIVRDDFFEGYDQVTRIAGRADFLQGIQPRQHIAFRHAAAYEDAYLLMGSWRGVLEHGV
jgi:hypothetical protein